MSYLLTKIRPIWVYIFFWMIYFYEVIWRHTHEVFTFFPIITIFCMSVSPLVGLVPYWKYAKMGISPVLGELSVYFFRYFSGKLLHCFHIITYFFFVCPAITWLTSLLKFSQYRDIFCSGWDIFLIFEKKFLWCLYSSSKYLLIPCMSVSLFVSLHP